MSCDWCLRLKGVRLATADNAGLTGGQRQATFGRAGTFLPRCSRNAHWVSPANPGFCRPCGEDRRNPDGSQEVPPMRWPPEGVFTRRSEAIAALQSGQCDVVVDISRRDRPRRGIMYDSREDKFVIIEGLAGQEGQPQPAAPAAVDISLDQEQINAWANKILSGEWRMGPHTPAQVVARVTDLLRESAPAEQPVRLPVPPPETVPEQTMPASLAPLPFPDSLLEGNPAAALFPPPIGVLAMTTPGPRSAPGWKGLGDQVRKWYEERKRMAYGPTQPEAAARQQEKKKGEAGKAPFDPELLHPKERDLLALANAVKVSARGNGVYDIQGTSGQYTVDLNAVSPFSTALGREVRGTCTCSDFRDRMGPAGLRCKHLLKAQMEEGMLGQGAAEWIKSEMGAASRMVAAIQNCLGISDPPAPSFGDSPPAQVDSTFQLTKEAKEVLRYVGGIVGMGYALAERGEPTMEGRAFGFYGPPGTGKNTVLRNMAAALGLPYIEITVDKRTDLNQLIGTVTLVEGPRGATVSAAALGPLGKALLEGAVVAINEINTMDPFQQSALYQIVQEGTFTIQSPEGTSLGTLRVHPSTIVGVTWNPMGGETDRPIPALFSRLYTMRMDFPPESEERAMLAKWAAGRGIPVVDEDITATVRLIRALRSEAEDQAIDTAATYRHAQQFYTCLQTTGGNVKLAARSLEGLLSQTYDYATQKAVLDNYLHRFFGERSGKTAPGATRDDEDAGGE